MTAYDQWLLNQAEKYTTSCEPKVVGTHQEPQDGEISTEPIFNCEDCQECDCDFWEDHNYPETRAEMDEALLWGI